MRKTEAETLLRRREMADRGPLGAYCCHGYVVAFAALQPGCLNERIFPRVCVGVASDTLKCTTLFKQSGELRPSMAGWV